MDIAGMSIALSQQKVMNQLGASILRMNLDTVEGMGDTMAATMNAMPSPSLESLVNPAVGGNIDIAI